MADEGTGGGKPAGATGEGEGGKPQGTPAAAPTEGEGGKPAGASTESDTTDWKAEARKHEDRAKADAKAREKAEKELAKLREEHQSDDEKALQKARDEGKSEATAAANLKLARASVIAAASGKLTDPGDAPSLIDMSTVDVDDDGNVDTEKVGKLIDDLVKKKPYLAAPRRPAGDAGQGPQGASGEGRPPTMDDWLREQAAGKR